MKNPQVRIPLATYNKIAPLINQQANSARSHMRLTHDQKITLAKRSKIQQLAKRFQQSEIQNARTKVSDTDVAMAMAIKGLPS